MIRAAVSVSAVVCTWSVMNAALLIRRGVQILPASLLPLVREPLSSLKIIGVSMIKMPAQAIILLGPSLVAIGFLLLVLAKPRPAHYGRRHFLNKVFVSLLIVVVAALAHGAVAERRPYRTEYEQLRENWQLRAVTSLLSSAYNELARADPAAAPSRAIPNIDEVKIELLQRREPSKPNIAIVILEGVQYRYTSLDKGQKSGDLAGGGRGKSDHDLTPYLASLAEQGVQFTNMRSSVTHSTKALFALLSGRYPSVAQDVAEAVPVAKPYAGLAAILKRKLGYRTAFFASCEGCFECAPGLAHNLGFEKFWAREALGDPNSFVGYMGCDEFAMLAPITNWVKADKGPFLLAVMCSVTHDPYQVPEWFAVPAREPLERYRQTIAYTDKFIAALDRMLARLNLADSTILCVVSDHGEGFGEHGLFAHARIPFEEALHVPWIMRAPDLIPASRKIEEPVSSVDLTPTILSLLGTDISAARFDGVDALSDIPTERRVYFSGWMKEGPAGFVEGSRKFVYDPTRKRLLIYDLNMDPLELAPEEPDHTRSERIVEDILDWQKNSVFQINQQRVGQLTLFGSWFCHWNNRFSSAKYRPEATY
jgi:hypothetical protein